MEVITRHSLNQATNAASLLWSLASAQYPEKNPLLVNTAIAQARDPVQMAVAFAGAVEAGWSARLAGPIEPRDLASPSTPVIGTAFRG